MFEKKSELALGGARAQQIAIEWVASRYFAGQQIQAEPTTFVLEVRLVAQARGGSGEPHVFGLDQLGRGIHPANGPHRERDGFALSEQRTHERAIAFAMWMPVSV